MHSRVAGIRRRRAAGAALALVLLARRRAHARRRLPGQPPTLPTGRPGRAVLRRRRRLPLRPRLPRQRIPHVLRRHDVESRRGADPAAHRRAWPAAPSRGDLTLTGLTGPGSAPTLSCRVPVGDHYEGALPLDAERIVGAGPATATVVTVGLRPGSGGALEGRPCWSRSPRTGSSRPNVRGSRLDGFDHPGRRSDPGHRAERLRRPPAGVFVTVVCVRDVRLRARPSTGAPAGVVVCDDAHVQDSGPSSRSPCATRSSGGTAGRCSGCRSTCGRSADRPTSGP